MSYKPEKIGRTHLARKAEARARRTAKRAAVRVMRHAAKRDPESAPTARITRGYLD